MSIAVLGSNGQLGKSLEKILADGDIPFNKYSSKEVDITEISQISSIDIPSVIINAAAYTDVEKAEIDQEKAFKANELGAKNIALYCREFEVPLIHLSTDYVFDGASNNPYTESDVVNPQSIYGKSKLAGELAIQKYCPKHIILRTSWVFSGFGKNFVKTMLKMSSNKELEVIDDLFGTPTDASELANAIIKLTPLVMEPQFESKILHFAGQESVSWFEFASIIFDEAIKNNFIEKIPIINPISSKLYQAKATRPINSSLSSEYFFNITGFKHPRLRDAIKKTVRNIYLQK